MAKYKDVSHRVVQVGDSDETMMQFHSDREMVEFYENFNKAHKVKKTGEELQIELPGETDDLLSEQPVNRSGGGHSAYQDDLDLTDNQFGNSFADTDYKWSLLGLSNDANDRESDPGLLLEEDGPTAANSDFALGSASTSSVTIEEDKSSRGHKYGFEKNGKDGAEVNQAPTDILLDNIGVQENDPEGTVVGIARAIDGNAGDKHSYELTDDASGLFAIDSETGEITVANGAALDHESGATKSITIRATDSGGLSYEKTFDIQINDVNERPTDILFGTEVDENAANGTPVWIAAAVDPDVGDTFTYELTDDAEGRFAIDSVTGEVTVADGSQLNYEDAASHDITIKVVDSGGLSYEETFTVDVLDVNEAPSDLTLNNDTVPADALSGSSVGTVSAVDPDAGETFAYALTDNAGGRFAIDGATGLVTVADAALLEPAPEGGYDITVRVTDSGGLSYEETFNLSLPPEGDGGFGGASVNGTPTAIALDNQSVQEVAAGAVVGQLTVTDPDAGDTHTFSVDDARFEVVGGQLTLKAGESLDHEAEETVSLTVTATDQGGLSTSQAFDISVLDVNEAPTDLTLSNDTVPADALSGSSVGTVSAVDPDADETFAYALTDSAGGRFAIDSATGEVTVADAGLLEPAPEGDYDITVRVTDSGDLSYDETFTLSLPPEVDGGFGGAGVNGTPTAIALDNQSVQEAAAGAVVGQLTVTDPDAGDSHTFSVDDARFEVVGEQLKLKAGESLDHEAGEQLSLTVTATDQGGLSTSQAFDIAVLDVNEAPTGILFGTDVDENAPNSTLVHVAVAVDPDVGDTHTYALLDDGGGRFAIDSATGAVTVADGSLLDFETATSHEITIQVTDSAGGSYEESFAIHINNINEAPTDLELSGAIVAEGSADGSSVGTVTVIDPDGSDSATFELLDDAGGRFAIDRISGQIRVANGSLLDFESSASHSVIVRATDAGGLFYDEDFTITVQDRVEVVNQAPTSITLNNFSLEENAAGAEVGTLAVSDPDVGDTHTFSVDDVRFEVVGDMLKLKDGVILDHETESEVKLNITATDPGGLSRTESFILPVLDVNEPPKTLNFIPTNSVQVQSQSVIFQSDFSDPWTANDIYETSNGFRVTYDVGTFNIENEALNIRVTAEQDAAWDGAGSGHHTEIEALADEWVDNRWIPLGETNLYSFSVYLENWSSDPSWEIITQWWQNPDSGEAARNPSLALYIKNDNYYLQIRADDNPITVDYQRAESINLGPVTSNVWIDWDFNVKFDPFGNAELSVWQNDELVYHESGTQIGFNDALGPVWHLGIYKYFGGSEVNERSLWLDNVSVSKAQEVSISDVVGVVSTQDPEGDSVFLSLLEDANGTFLIDSQSGEIRVSNGTLLDLDEGKNYAITVRATDNVGSSTDKDFTVTMFLNKSYEGDSMADITVSEGHFNSILGSNDSDVLNGQIDDDFISGLSGDDVLNGGGGNDVLFGGAGSDMLDGGDGYNHLNGGEGSDSIHVDKGSNIISYTNIFDGGDQIIGYDQSGNDIIDLDGIFDTLQVNTEDRSERIDVTTNNNTATIFVDTSGDGIYDMQIATLSGINGDILSIDEEVANIVYGAV